MRPHKMGAGSSRVIIIASHQTRPTTAGYLTRDRLPSNVTCTIVPSLYRYSRKWNNELMYGKRRYIDLYDIKI